VNQLATATSPYLLQHADNPVDWHQWGETAFASARQRDVPILLSVGYAACHWCHVMAHESFEDPATAALMNEHFVNIKVDREERPDVDAVYMDAVTAMTGQGGWPMTVFLTPEGRPFFAGTYFPSVRTRGMPAFSDVLRAVSQAWQTHREAIEQQGEAIVERIESLRVEVGGVPTRGLDDADLADAVATLARQYDHRFGGFGGAPKFPPSMVVEFLLREHARTGDGDALLMAEGTLRAMAMGGIYDQLGGGFARYSVDSAWVVPHFEKMLYDNALLLRVYVDVYRATRRAWARRAVVDTGDFLLRELLTDEGGFASSLDADSDGVEGQFYVWTPAQLFEVLGADDAAWAGELLAVADEGSFEHGASTLQLTREIDDLSRWRSVRDRLLAARELRVRPARDDKVVTSWNGLAIAALANAGALLERPDFVAAAARAAAAVVGTHLVEDRLRRASRDGVVGEPLAVLDDYGNLAEGLFALYAVTGDQAWFHRAVTLVDQAVDLFAAPEDGAFFDTGRDAEQLVRRPRDPTDNASPSGHASLVGALLTAAAYTGSHSYRSRADDGLAAVRQLAVASPRFAGWSLAVAAASASGPLEVAVVGPPGADRDALHRLALQTTAPGAAIAVGTQESTVPLLAGRRSPGPGAWVHVCERFVCALPVQDPAVVREKLRVDVSR